MESCWRSALRILVVLLTCSVLCSGARGGPVGVCYGRDGDNLPTPIQAVNLLQTMGVTRARIFDANSSVIQAFADSGIDLGITINNAELPNIALSQAYSDNWIATNVLPYVPATNISHISVGSEVIFDNSGNTSAYLVLAMSNIYSSLRTQNLVGTGTAKMNIQVTTSNAMNVLSLSYPPSAGTFDPAITSIIIPLLRFLSQTRAPFLLNSYPYYAYVGDPQGIALSYALFTSNNGIVDSGNQLQYTNLLDAQIDAVFAAMSRINFTGIEMVVAETGWPSKGDANETAASVKNAQTYNQNLINHIVTGGGTPLMQSVTFQTYVFALFNEDLKPGPSSERNFGIDNAVGTPVYALNFEGGTSQEVSRNRTWCIARTDATNASLAIGINYACGEGKADCRAINLGGDCYNPNTYVNHADYAYNAFYQASNMDERSCNFSNTATLTQRNPSYSNCVFFAKSQNAAQNLLQELQQAQFSLTLLLSLFLILKLRD